ncbi:MAG: tetratricopeptide repeat protein [Candidatus Cloacimonetes bacterium]|nr:tetratricopeptide repeat protein [Candidatus Cloacimonadota bacterium]HNZ07835.1 tetratricopeptide repeat protein [Candidatus Cloacimonadota bacterium]HOH79735.1 tetratricopeptide repeat protein [Candidatus Cloacimonadota bacterium]HPN41499.1 tetratricopeptide repeat protein [Candidatus Cloacimonadota bacterium]
MTDQSLNNLILRAEALMKTNWLHAVHLLEEAISTHPEDPRALISLGEFYMRRQMYPQAIAKLQSALQLAANDDLIKYLIGNCFFADGNYRMAVVYYDQIASPWNDILYNKALALAYMGKSQESVVIIRELVKYPDANPFIYFLLVEQLLRNQEYKEALRYVQLAEGKMGKHKHLMLLKALIYSRLEVWIQAYDSFTKADADQGLTNSDYLHSYAVSAMRIGLDSKAIELLHRALEDNPYSSLFYEELLRLLIQQKDMKAARKVLTQAKKHVTRFNPMLKLLQARITNEEGSN